MRSGFARGERRRAQKSAFRARKTVDMARSTAYFGGRSRPGSGQVKALAEGKEPAASDRVRRPPEPPGPAYTCPDSGQTSFASELGPGQSLSRESPPRRTRKSLTSLLT